MSAHIIAATNFTQHLQQNPYPGRGFVVGRSATEVAWLIVYWITGRSTRSQNRRLVADGATLRTEPVDAQQLADPSLIIYEAMLELPGQYLFGNGEQVRALYTAIQAGGNFDAALAPWAQEPDAPNYTPRISGLLDLRTPPGCLTLSILKSNPANPEATDRFTYRPALPPAGLGVGLTTYRGDGEPLPSFAGEPLLLPCRGRAEEVLQAYWHALDTRNRIAIAVKRIPVDGSRSAIIIHNRFA